MKVQLWLPFVLSLSSLFACAPSQPLTGNEALTLPACLSDQSCSLDQCDTLLCKRIANTKVHVEIEPSPRSGYVSQQYLNVPLGVLLGQGLQLKPVVYFYGTLLGGKADTILSPVGVRDISDMSSDIIAIPLVGLADQSVLSTSVNSVGSFSLALVSGQNYRLIANPLGFNDKAPTFIDLTINDNYASDIALPESGRKISGVVKQSAFSKDVLADKLWIRVVQNKRQVSSIGHLYPDGHFTLTLSNALFEKDTEKFPVYLLIEPTSDASFLQSVRVKIDLEQNEDDIDVGSFDLGPSAPLIRAHIRVVGGSDETPLKDARVMIRASSANGYLQASTLSNANGIAEIIVPKGSYNLAIVPQQDSAYGFKKLNALVFADENPLLVRLDPRDILKSSLYDEDGNPIVGARIVLTRIARSNSDTLEAIFGDTEVRLEARSNSKGQWCVLSSVNTPNACNPVRLDAGRYRLQITPPEGASLPFLSQVFDFPKSSEVAVVLKKAILLQGRLLAPKAELPVSNSFIRIYSAKAEEEGDQARFLTQAFTRGDGSFIAVLPQDYIVNTPASR